jgi:hypothetical protein
VANVSLKGCFFFGKKRNKSILTGPIRHHPARAQHELQHTSHVSWAAKKPYLKATLTGQSVSISCFDVFNSMLCHPQSCCCALDFGLLYSLVYYTARQLPVLRWSRVACGPFIPRSLATAVPHSCGPSLMRSLTHAVPHSCGPRSHSPLPCKPWLPRSLAPAVPGSCGPSLPWSLAPAVPRSRSPSLVRSLAHAVPCSCGPWLMRSLAHAVPRSCGLSQMWSLAYGVPR